MCFIDFKKAFDMVDRNLLLYKLAKIGISGHMYRAVSSLYTNPKSRVMLQEYFTEYFECPMGVKQGDCLSPTLFAIFINDLAIDIEQSGLGINIQFDNESGDTVSKIISILLYADDIVLFSENEEEMQSLLYLVQCWCEKFKLQVNLTKTNILHVRPKRRSRSNFVFLFNRRS